MISTKRFEESNVFDVISTFNVADHTGMLTLLLLTRPLLKPGGALLTTMFLQKKKPKSNKNVRFWLPCCWVQGGKRYESCVPRYAPDGPIGLCRIFLGEG